MIHSSLTPPAIDQATIDRAIARGKRERSRAIFAMVRGLFARRPRSQAAAAGTGKAHVAA